MNLDEKIKKLKRKIELERKKMKKRNNGEKKKSELHEGRLRIKGMREAT